MERVKKSLLELDIDFSNEVIEKLIFFSNKLFETSKNFNLTGYKSIDEIVDFLLIRSFRYIKAIKNYKNNNLFLKENLHVLDLGTGAGIPSLPIKFIYPDLDLKLVDSSEKKCEFIEEIITIMELKKINIQCTRAELLGVSEEREKYDIVLTRALAKLPTLAELSVPLLRVGGFVITAKGEFPKIELEQSKYITNILGVKKTDIILIEAPKYLPKDNFIIWKKNSKTPKGYPRRNGIPKKNPIINKKVI